MLNFETLDSLSDSCVLNSSCEIEDLLEVIHKLDSRIERFSALKKYRVDAIDTEINQLKEKIEVMRQVILNTMKKYDPDEKTLHFPGVGKVSRRETKGSWIVKDEDVLIKYLEQHNLTQGIVNTSVSINKKEMKKVLDSIDDTVPGVEKTADSDGISISFEDESKDVKKPISAAPQVKSLDSRQKVSLSTLEL